MAVLLKIVDSVWRKEIGRRIGWRFSPMEQALARAGTKEEVRKKRSVRKYTESLMTDANTRPLFHLSVSIPL